MKFICSVTIHKSKEMVAKIFANPDFLGEYQESFLRKVIVSGKSFEVDTISKMYYKMGKEEMELTETVLTNNLPNSFSAFYFHKHTENTMTSIFTSIDENSTLYEAEINYVKFKGVVVKLMKLIFPSMFKKQVQKWLDNFKVFAEKQS